MDKNKGGRPRKYAEDDPEKTERKTVTLKRRQVTAIMLLQRDDEDFSTTLQRILDGHPLFSK
jgi:hypothetical protein